MATLGEERSRVARPRRDYDSILVIVIFILCFSAIIIIVASLETQCVGFCDYTQVEELTITRATFGSIPGQVTFGLHNAGPMDVTIVQVFQGSNNNRNATVSTNIVIHPMSNLTVTVTFPGVTFQAGTQYDFGMVSAHGSTFPASGTP